MKLRLQPDLVVAIGPNCRNTFNIRSYFGTDRAYPFDWWITPIASALYMMRPEFRFDVTIDDLSVIETGGVYNSVYNRRLHVLHHHDFPRVNQRVSRPTTAELAPFNQKYQALFRRLHDHISQAREILFVSSRLQNGLSETDFSACLTPELERRISLAEAGATLRHLFGDKARLLVVDAGEAAEAHDDMTSWVRRPDDGTRLYARGHRFAYAEPVNVYQTVFDALELQGLRPESFHVEQIKDPDVELQRS